MRILSCLYIFLSAFLLFQIQPLMSKHLLPPFGGVPAVWLACMLFFQAVLLAGYLYAHVTSISLKPRTQIVLHCCLILVSVLFLPWALPRLPVSGDRPNLLILSVLTTAVGLPYFVLSTTSPLLQRWFTLSRTGRAPYWLYSISNLGSLGALVSYPLLIEPTIGLVRQSRLWSLGYLLFSVLGCLIAAAVVRQQGALVVPEKEKSAPAAPPSKNSHLYWFLQAACGSLLLYAFTAVITTDIAPIPLLWVAPLVVYLITFILTFHSPAWFRPKLYAVLLLSLYLVFSLLAEGSSLPPTLAAKVGLMLSLLFACCMVCHGTLAATKPAPEFLTGFYLTISAGGVAGGIFSSLIAPFLFTDYVEFPIGILGSIAILGVALMKRGKAAPPPALRMLLASAAIIAVSAALLRTSSLASGAIVRTRNFFGVLKVTEAGEGRNRRNVLSHGSTVHGFQFLDPAREKEKTGYFTEQSGVGLAFAALMRSSPLSVGIIGLGAGTIAAYGRPGDIFYYSEIDPEVETLARKYFSFISGSAADVQVAITDGRLAVGSFPPESLDIVVIDAFSGGSIPIHLLTHEAFNVYVNALKKDAVLILHLSNKYLDLTPAISAQAASFNLSGCLVKDPMAGVVYALLGKHMDICSLEPVRSSPARAPLPAPLPERWTDDFSSVFPLLRLRVEP